ncbi:MAG: hypothetical protein H6R04_641 [Burkholderiaceae bacterium]|nr:hypothetical protein [Burkholderiaceae bacterium]
MATRKYKKLAKHAGIWRVDGVGYLRDSEHPGSRTVIHFSGLNGVGPHLDPYHSLASNGEHLHFPVHTASLHHFRVGSIWRDGERILRSILLSDRYEIDASRAKLVTLDEEIILNGHAVSTVVPEKYFSLGENRDHLAKTYYVIVPVLRNSRTKWLVIPAAEMLRFYYGTSTRMLTATLRKALDKLYDPKKSRMEEGVPIIHLKRPIFRKEAAVLSRLVASQDARVELKKIRQHIEVTHANNKANKDSEQKPLSIKVSFPFKGITTVYVLGKRMPLTDAKTEWAVLAMEIMSCSRPFGFSEVTYEFEELNFRGQGGRTGGGSDIPPKHRGVVDDETESELADVPANKRMPRLIVNQISNPFPSFNQVKTTYHAKGSGNGRHFQRVVDVDVNKLTMNGGSNSEDAQGNLGINEHQVGPGKIERKLSNFIAMLKHLRSALSGEWNVTTRELDEGVVENGEWVTFFPLKIGKRRTWHLVLGEDGIKRSRQVVCVEVQSKTKDQYFYLLEMELRPNESGQCTILLYSGEQASVENDTIKELLYLTAMQNRWASSENEWKNDSDAARAKKFFAKIKMARINHPPGARKKDDGKNAMQREEPDPKIWSEKIIEGIKGEILLEI